MGRRSSRRARFYDRRRRARRGPCWVGPDEYDHNWRYVSDWYGDPGVINGTADCSHAECETCGAIDPDAEPPEFEDFGDYDYLED
jgi:hypothetical protein